MVISNKKKKKKKHTSGIQGHISACMTADMLQQGGAAPRLEENVNLSRLGNLEYMPGMPGQVSGILCLFLPLLPHTPPPQSISPITHTLASEKDVRR